MQKPPISFLVDQFTYEEYDGLNDWSEAQHKAPQAISFCRIDRVTVYTTTAGTGRQLEYRAVIFCYEGLTSPMVDFKEQSRVTFDGQTHTITRVIANKEPFSSQLYSVELEVV